MDSWIERHSTLVLASVMLMVALAIGGLALRLKPAASIIIEPPPPTSTPSPVQVYISGAVHNPDVYELPPSALVRDLLDAAGGSLPDANLDAINLAAELADGDHIYVPFIGETSVPAPSGSGSAGAVVGGLVNINTASQGELEQLPGIGPVLAAAIIQYREQNGPFESIEAIQNVPGIGPAKFEEIKDLITVN